MSLRLFPKKWFRPTDEAREAVCMIAEGFCPFFETGPGLEQWALDRDGRCEHCEAHWKLVRDCSGDLVGFSATWGKSPYISTLAAYPFRQDKISGSAYGDVKSSWLGYGRPL